jgi:glycosidase
MFEINARVFVRRLSEKYGRPVTLGTVPDDEWKDIARRGFDLVWAMGVWQRSPVARLKALSDAGLRREYDRALPGWTDEDVMGSPYAVYGYTLDAGLGDKGDLAELKSSLNREGLGLVVDFVPNHLALDHPWTLSHPGRFVQGSESDARDHPDWFFSPGGRIHLAHGRDPNFPPWSDTVQVNFYSKDLRQAFVDELVRIAGVADGVRCDMAMLALNRVFGDVWGHVVHSSAPPEAEFWAEAIGQVKRQRPGFLFLAEAYWGLEDELRTLGFDFAYDKSLYDRLRSSPAGEVRGYLEGDGRDGGRTVRFIENHDEPRAAAAFGPERSRAAAVVLGTVPGLRLFHDGQFEGRRIRLPVQLAREPREDDVPGLSQFYDRLLAICGRQVFHEGEWSVVPAGPAWEGNGSHDSLLAWTWRTPAELKAVAVNYSPSQAQGRLWIPQMPEDAGSIRLTDELGDTTWIRDGGDLRGQGLYVDLGPWQAHILDIAAG